MGRIYFLIILIFFNLEAKLVKNGNFIIDTKNQLIWLDIKDNIYKQLTHQEAIIYCKKKGVGWRLPNVDEFKTILDYNRLKKEEIAITKDIKYVIQDDYWTSDRTWIRNFGLYAYYLRVKVGDFFYQNRSYKKFVICVKDLR